MTCKFEFLPEVTVSDCKNTKPKDNNTNSEEVN